MAMYVYNTTTGALVSYSPDDSSPVASQQALAAKGLAVVTGLPALGPTVAWDPVNKTTKTVTAPATPAPSIPTWQFIMLFTPAEHQAIAASTDPKVQQFLMAIQASQTVNLGDAIIQGGIAYLVSIGLLTQDNATLILSGQSSQ